MTAGPGRLTVRPARRADLEAIAAVYNEAVRTSVATFDTEPQVPDVFAERIASERPGDHVLVAEDHRRVLGMAYAATYRPRPAYDRTRETSVYLAPDARGRGVGRALYDELLQRVDADGIHVCLAVIAGPNPASEALHRAVGFRHAGTLPEVGRKFGRWVDTAWWVRIHPAQGDGSVAG